MRILKRQEQFNGLCRLNNTFSENIKQRSNEPPYQMLGKRTLVSSIGLMETKYVHFWLALLLECLSCGLYVFVVCSTRISWTGSIIGHEPNLVAMALASGISMILLLFAFRSVHVNPAITIAFLVTGRIPLIRALSYILVHCLGAVAAITFLYSVSVKGHAGALGLDNPHTQLDSWQILTVEIVISFIVTFTTFATSNYSSYACAKKYILSQLNNNYQGEQQLLQPTNRSPSLFGDIGESSHNTNSITNNCASRRSRRTIAPIVSHNNPASISVINTATAAVTSHHPMHKRVVNDNINAGSGGGVKDLIMMNEQQQNNMTHNHHQHNTSKEFYSNEYYSQVYDDYTDPNLTPLEQNNENPFPQIDSGYSNCSSSNNNNSSSLIVNNNNNQNVNNKTLPQVLEYDYELGGGVGGLRTITATSNLNGLIKADFQEYDDYDNHRIYATQQLKSISTNGDSLESIVEQAMQEESQLLGPNGFPFRVTNAQAFIIGLAYILTSLSGIPVSGASLNPARSFGPAFIMNRWDRHWIFWTGPILGAVIAGLLYEFIFSPLKRSSLCYRPKLFRLKAQDLVKVHCKSRLDQPHQRPQQRFLPQPPQLIKQQHHQQQQQQQLQHHQQSATTSTRPNSTMTATQNLSQIHAAPHLQTLGAKNRLSDSFGVNNNLNATNAHLHFNSHRQQQPSTIANFNRTSLMANNSKSHMHPQQYHQQQQHLQQLHVPQHSGQLADMGKFYLPEDIIKPPFSDV